MKNLSELTNLIKCISNDIHWIHFNAKGTGFYRLHELCQSFYEKLDEQYDDLVELCIQTELPIVNPSKVAATIGHIVKTDTDYDIGKGLAEIFDMMESLIKDVQDHVVYLHSLDTFSHSVMYLEDFIKYWRKEIHYKLHRMLLN